MVYGQALFFLCFPHFACLVLLARFMLAVARPTNKKNNVYYTGYHLIAVITEPSLATVEITWKQGLNIRELKASLC